LHKNKKE